MTELKKLKSIIAFFLFFIASFISTVAAHVASSHKTTLNDFSHTYSHLVNHKKIINNDFSHTYSHLVNHKKIINNEYLWHEANSTPFSELIFSWNALRPIRGKFIFFVSVLHKRWSSWIKVAEWGSNIQKSFSNKQDRVVKFRVAPITFRNKVYGSGFRVRVIACQNADLNDLKYLFACTSIPEKFNIISPANYLEDVLIEGVPKQSQMTLDHPRYLHICSPTSTSVVINFLYKHFMHRPYNCVDAVNFAEEVRDQVFGVYGNSVLNVAAAFDALEGKIPCRVQRLNSFEQLHSYLKLNIPVVVSIHGPIRGGALPYRAGHFMVITGWDSESQSVVCMDPAFKTTKATETCYFIKDFLKAWARSRNLSYVFLPYGI